MPKLLIFAVCREAIINAQDQSISAISILPGLTVPVPPGEPVSEDTIAPLFFGIAAYWLVQPEDRGKWFEHRFQIVKPNGEIYPMSTIPLLADKGNVSVVLQGVGFPVGLVGVHLVTMDLREIEPDKEWIRLGEYPMEVFHVTQEEGSVDAN